MVGSAAKGAFPLGLPTLRIHVHMHNWEEKTKKRVCLLMGSQEVRIILHLTSNYSFLSLLEVLVIRRNVCLECFHTACHGLGGSADSVSHEVLVQLLH